MIGIGWNEFARTHPTMALGPPQRDLTDIEQRAHFSLWAMLAAPMLAGNDVRAMTPQTLSILINRDVIAVDQDPLVAQGHPLESDTRVWVKPLADGAAAVALTNAGATSDAVGTTAAALGLPHSDCYRVLDLWGHTESVDSGAIGPVQIPPHGAAMFRVSTCG